MMMRSLFFSLGLASLATVATTTVAAGSGWAELNPEVAARVASGAPVVIHVTVPLCHHEQIDCGSRAAGDPGRPETNLYWGAIFGAKRMFARSRSGWSALTSTREVPGVLERAVYRRYVDGASWGRDDEEVEVLVVLDAIHGDAIDDAVAGFFRRATRGGTIVIDDGARRRTLALSAAGYAGHNRLMDGLALPEVKRAHPKAVASFVLACFSDSYFSDALRRAGSSPVVMTRSLMAPEGYVVDAVAKGLGRNEGAATVRARAVHAYARWQRIAVRVAERVFARVRSRRRGD